jgi:peptidoglycan hydrolase-like protein with peptidoglycan-binding domain
LAEGNKWPRKGYDGPQPWELVDAQRAAELVSKEHAGEPNDAGPVVIGHDRPILTSGSAGPDVEELARRLGDLGYSNSVTEGENPFAVLDQSILGAARAFAGDYGVREDPSGFGGSEREAEGHIGPWLWEAVLCASEDNPHELELDEAEPHEDDEHEHEAEREHEPVG